MQAVVVVNTVEATETAVSTNTIPPSSTPIPTIMPTAIPSPTVIATPSMPLASIVFARDNVLQQWIPQTNEIKTLAEDVYLNAVYSWVKYSGDVVLFLREIVPEKEYDLILFHIPTQTEDVVRRIYSRKLITPTTIIYSFPSASSFSISHDGKWLAYVADEKRERNATLFVHEIFVSNQQVAIAPPLFTYSPTEHSQLFAIDFLETAKNQISWSDHDGRWVADLTENPIKPMIVMLPSGNTEFLPEFLCDSTEPCIANTAYIINTWSPDGRYLLAVERELGDGLWYVIEAITGKSFQIPDAYSAAYGYSDSFIWIDQTNFAQFNLDKQVLIWRVDFQQEPFVSLEKTIQLPSDMGDGIWGAVVMPNNHVRFGASALSGPAASAFYDLNLDTDELIKLSPDNVQREISLYWSPDRQYVLSEETFMDDSLLLFALDGSQPIDIHSVFGLGSCCWYWYEDHLRTP
jgi:hypothetical protein